MTHYEITIAGVTRKLPICKIHDNLFIAGFVIFGDVEMTMKAAKALIDIAPEYDVIITAESKGIPLVYEMARLKDAQKYIVARKKPKLYMEEPISVEVKSITTDGVQELYLDVNDVNYIKGKRVLIVDDVISTGESLLALEQLVQIAGGQICGKMAILAEGEARDRKDIIYLKELPLFDEDFNEIWA